MAAQDFGLVKVRLQFIHPYQWDKPDRRLVVKLGHYADTATVQEPVWELHDYRTTTQNFLRTATRGGDFVDRLKAQIRKNALLKIKGTRLILTDIRGDLEPTQRLEIRYNRDPSEEAWILREDNSVFLGQMRSIGQTGLVTTTQITVTSDEHPYVIERTFSLNNDRLGTLSLTSTAKWIPNW